MDYILHLNDGGVVEMVGMESEMAAVNRAAQVLIARGEVARDISIGLSWQPASAVSRLGDLGDAEVLELYDMDDEEICVGMLSRPAVEWSQLSPETQAMRERLLAHYKTAVHFEVD